jgi:signal transduction histidine kinase
VAWHRRGSRGPRRNEVRGIRGGDTDTYQALANRLDGLFDRLSSSPTSRASVRDALREAFEDEGLEIAWRRAGGDYVDAEGRHLDVSGHAADRLLSGGRSTAQSVLVIHNRRLSETPSVVRIVVRAAVMALQAAERRAHAETTLQDLADARLRLVAAADLERRRIERDLHDGAQQHLISLQVKASLIQHLITTDPTAAHRMLSELGADAEAALGQVRELARGVYPPTLDHEGLAAALRRETRRLPLPVVITRAGTRRFPPHVERALYFCSVEAIQNVLKHAGHHATINITILDEDDNVEVEITDTGRGFDTAASQNGSGLANMTDRIGALGGAVTVTSSIGHGSVIRCNVPLTRR